MAIFLFGSVAAAQEKPAGMETKAPIIVYKSSFPIVLEGREYDLTTMVIDFPAGAAFPKHFHGAM